jgi:xylulose-5-phosphate/fructose-6-phosphate phosphoketolase
VPGLAERAAHLRQRMSDERLRHRAYTREHGEDPPALSDWSWPFAADDDATAPSRLSAARDA